MSAYGFGNLAHYRGETAADIREILQREQDKSRTEYIGLAEQLAALIGWNEYDAWVDANITGPWSRNVELIKSKLAELRGE